MSENNISGKDITEITVQSLAQLVPFGIGSAIATAWSGVDTKLRFKRLEYFCKILDEKVRELGENAFNKKDINSEEVHSIMLQIKEKIEREHRDQKIELFRDYLINILRKGKDLIYEKKKFFLEILDELDNVHIVILKCLSGSPDKEMHAYKIMRDLVKWDPMKGERELETKDDYFISAAFEKLNTLQFINPVAIGPNPLLSKNKNASQNYSLTPLGKEFVDFILNLEKVPS